MSKTVAIKKWVGHKLDAAIDRRLQRLVVANDVTEVCVMPDVHLAGDVCNGVVVATKQLIYPQCIGGDIGCGYLSVALGTRCLLYTSPSPRDQRGSRMPSSA